MSGGRAWLLVAGLALAASANSLGNGFVYDDVPVVQHDVRIRSLHTGLLAMPYWDETTRDRLYRPLTSASFAVDYAIGNGSPFTFHLSNLVLHTLVTLLCFACALRVLASARCAFVAAALFAVHPVHTEAVANIVGRAELIAATGYLIAVLAWLSRRRAAPLVVMAGALIAFGGKEHALTLPAALLLLEAWRTRWRGAAWLEGMRAKLVTFAGVLALALGFLAARGAVIGTSTGGGVVAAGLEQLSAAERAMVMSPALLVWTRLLIVPWKLSADYSPNHFVPMTQLSPAHAAAWLMLIALLVLAWRARHRLPAATLGAGWMIVTAAVAANVVVPTGIMIAERTLYLPSAGFALLVGALWTLLPPGRGLWPATATLIALLGARSVVRNPVWRDTDRFYEALIRDAPDSYRAHWARGARAFEAGRMAEGERRYLEAIRLYPGDGAVMQELGERYLAAGAFAPADRWLTNAWRVDSMRFDAGIAAVLARLRRQQPDSAASMAASVIRRFPDAPTIYLAAADAELARGDSVLALSLRRRAVFAGPRVWQLQYSAADGAARAGLCVEALWRAQQAVTLGPDEPLPRSLLSRLRDGQCRSA